MKNKNQRLLRLAIISVVATISLLIGLVVYYDSLVTNLQDSTCKTLEEITQQEKNNFTKTMHFDLATLKGFSTVIGLVMDNREDLVPVLETITKSTDFEHTFFADPDGTAINDRGTKTNVSDRDYFSRALAGETVLSEPIQSKLRDAYVIAAATPVRKDGRIIGVLIGSFEAKKLNSLFMSSFEGFGYTYIATNTGELIARTESVHALALSGNLFTMYKDADFYRNDDYETMLQNLVEGRGGHSQYRINGQQRLMHYNKLPVNDWNIFVIVRPEGVEKTANLILRNAILLTAVLVIIFLALLSYIHRSQRRFTKELEKLAYVDDVTGYRSFSKFKLDAISVVREQTELHFMLIKMDIENFKLINEIYSMEIGDQVLKAVAETLASITERECDLFGRIYADEFVMLVSFSAEEVWLEKKQQFEERLAQSCAELIDFKLVMPKGRYRLQKGETDFSQIYEKVNFAHRFAKNNGSRDLVFDGKIQEQAIWEKEVERKMETALHQGEFHLFMQPAYRLSDGQIAGAEAFTHWIVDGKNVACSDVLMQLFERTGFVIQLDLYMFEKVCATLRTWIDGGLEPIAISVNFSRLHLNSPTFLEELSEIADRYEIPHSLLEIELTETAIPGDPAQLEGFLDRLQKAHFILSMDDFGTGCSFLGLLKNSGVDAIKIGKAFFEPSSDRERAKAVLSSVVEMARKLDIRTVAKGVETEAHIELLRKLGFQIVQGDYLATPMPAEQLEMKLLRNAFAEQTDSISRN